MRLATSSGCSFTIIRPAPGRPATPCSAIWPAATRRRSRQGKPHQPKRDGRDKPGHENREPLMSKHAPAAGPGMIERLAHWVLAPRAEEISAVAVEQAKLLVLDTIGCGYAALAEES